MTRPALLHQTDLFRPFIDPDDHWDLACVYALAAGGHFHLGGVLLDYPPDAFPGRSPDVTGIAQLSYITGLPVNLSVGASRHFVADATELASWPAHELAGARFVLDYLRRHEGAAYITIVGSCRDVAIAGTLDPDLFAEKCAGIYLNAGTGHPDPTRRTRVEYNVTLNAAAYAAIFDIPCPLYWMPCFELLDGERGVMQFGTFYKFNQADILPELSPRLRGYFTCSLEPRTDTRYLQPVVTPDSEAASSYTIRSHRNMWCTAGFFHAAGFGIDAAGKRLPLADGGSGAVCGFRPVHVTCDAEGTTSWEDAEGETRQYVFEVFDLENYERAMTVAMRDLLKEVV
jgi:hypothetical protein